MTSRISSILLPIAIVCSAIAFPAMTFERLLPRMPASERLEWDTARSIYHNLKNITTEFLRADAQWWSKFLAFVILVLVILNIIQFIRYRRLKGGK